jgi:hypothetical protein
MESHPQGDARKEPITIFISSRHDHLGCGASCHPGWHPARDCESRLLPRLDPLCRKALLRIAESHERRIANIEGGEAKDAPLFGRTCPLMSGLLAPYSLCMTPTQSPSPHDEMLKTLQLYVDGSKQGKSELMRPPFHPDASFFGYAGDRLAAGTGQFARPICDSSPGAPNVRYRLRLQARHPGHVSVRESEFRNRLTSGGSPR